MQPKFIHLRLHSEFSIQDSLVHIPALIKQAKTFEMPAIALTDVSNLYAAVKFYKEAMKQGIKPIIGADIYVAANDKQKSTTLLTLLCQSQEGYLNLVKLISRAHLEGQSSGKPLIPINWLNDLNQGLIALSGGIEGNIGQALINKDSKLAKAHLKQWQSVFPNRFYLEITRLGKANENLHIQQAVKLAEASKIPLVASNDVRFINAEDFEAHEARVCIQSGHILADNNRPKQYSEQQYFRSQEEMLELFKDIPEALANTVEIAKRCNVHFELGVNRLPHFPIPEGETIESYLKKVAQQGLEKRLARTFDTTSPDFKEKRIAYDERLERELDVINSMGFPGYFLIVADFTKWAKQNNIPVGPGRGSGPGSLVAYSLYITDLDPIDLELLFERFLNPERVSMPDFDIDFCMDGRDRVIEYVMKTHGYDAVSQIITYGTMAAKAVVRDVGRVLGLSYGFVDKIAKLIPFELGMTLKLAMRQEPMLQERYDQEEDVKILIDLALKLEGLTRNVGRHAGGIVIAPGKLTDFVPLYCEPNEPNHPVTQFDKDDVEAVGLVKFDFLGLKTLTIIDRATKLVEQQSKEKIDIGLIPLNDKKTFDLLKAYQSTAVFQLESHGMRDLIKRLQPDRFEDLIALVALFRPGPLQSGMVDDFINRKHGRSKVIYPHPKLEPILSPTYGVILYQEQVMQIAQVLAGYTLGAADILRRAMGKKKPEEMAKQREIFTKGAVERGVDKDVATYIFDLMEKFAGYGFNKSHSASYALIAYQTAWLKAHHPAAFMAAVLSSDMDRTDKILLFLDDCKTQGIKVAPPDINRSHYDFKVSGEKALQYGFGAIKGVGEAAIESIMQARQNGGEFTDIFDFCERIDLRKANKRVLEALIKSGSFDCFKQDRAIILATLPKALQHADQLQSNAEHGQHDLLALEHSTASKPDYEHATHWDEMTRLQGEKETLGFFLTGHPLNQYKSDLKHITSCQIKDLSPSSHKQASIAAIITSFRTRQTKRGDRMGILTLDDGTAQLDAVCFSDTYNKYRPLLAADQLVLVEGEISHDDFSHGNRMTIRDVYTIEDAREKHIKSLNIIINADKPFDDKLLKELLTTHKGGHCAVVIKYIKDNAQANIQLGKDWLVKPSQSLLDLLKMHVSEEVEVAY